MTKKASKHIEIVRSSNPLLSSMGQKSCDMIRDILKQKYDRVGITTVDNLADLEALASQRPDLVFLGVKQLPMNRDQDNSKRIWLADYLDARSINYTGSSASAIELDFEKPMAKRLMQNFGIATTPFFMANHGQYYKDDILPLAFPLFVKPPSSGGGKGIGADSVVRDFDAFSRKVRSIAIRFQSDSLVEEYLTGREFSVAILEDEKNEDLIIMPIELVTEENIHGDRILGSQIKSDDNERIIKVYDPAIKKIVSELAGTIFKTLGARDYGRIDIRLDAKNTPHFLEANLVPGLAQHGFTSYFTAACELNRSMSHSDMIHHIVKHAILRGSTILNQDVDSDSHTNAKLMFGKVPELLLSK